MPAVSSGMRKAGMPARAARTVACDRREGAQRERVRAVAREVLAQRRVEAAERAEREAQREQHSPARRRRGATDRRRCRRSRSARTARSAERGSRAPAGARCRPATLRGGARRHLGRRGSCGDACPCCSGSLQASVSSGECRATTRPTPAASSSGAARGPGRLHFRDTPEREGQRGQRLDGVLAAALLVAETLLCLSVWGPQPLAWLWIGSQVDYRVDSNMLGIVVAFLGILVSLFVTLSLASRLDRPVAPRAARRRSRPARGRTGADLRGFRRDRAGGCSCIWFLVIQGPAPSLA